MTDIAIRCEGLSKQYRIGEQERYKALRDVITEAAASPFRRLRSVFDRRPPTVGTADNGSHADVSPSPVVGQASADGNGSYSRNPPSEIRDSIWALDDVSFEVKRGEVVGIIGRNGAGKSTLLKILSRITKPTKGHAEIHGRVGSLLEVGTGFHPELTGRENIYLNAAILGMRKAEVARKFDEIVDFAEVEKFIDTPVKRYSSGMYVRLAFAVAAHMETEVLLVDEVLAVGDAQFQRKCLGRMGAVAKEGRTVLFVSHDMSAVQVLCEKTIYLGRGRMYDFGVTSKQISNYLTGRKNAAMVSETQRVRLGNKVELRRFEFSPNPVSSNDDVRFDLHLASASPLRLDDIAILIYSSLRTRLAIVDLRRHDRTYRLNSTRGERISGCIHRLPLVTGDYQIGLYLNWGEGKGDFYDLLDLTVVSAPGSGEIIPYDPSARGMVELDYTLAESQLS